MCQQHDIDLLLFLQGAQAKLTVNNISSKELLPVDEEGLLGEGSFGQCFIRTYTRLNIQVIEKKKCWQAVQEISLRKHKLCICFPNIIFQTILGVQFDQHPFSIVMQFIGNNYLLSTVYHLLQQHDVHLRKRDWIKISFNVGGAWAHVLKRGISNAI